MWDSRDVLFERPASLPYAMALSGCGDGVVGWLAARYGASFSCSTLSWGYSVSWVITGVVVWIGVLCVWLLVGFRFVMVSWVV